MKPNQESALTLASSSPLDESDPHRVWLLAYPDRQKFYLTDAERRQFLGEIAQDKMIVQIGTYTMTNRFSYLYQYKKKLSNKKYVIEGDNAREL